MTPPPASVPGWTPGPPPLDRDQCWVVERSGLTYLIKIVRGRIACRHYWLYPNEINQHYGPIPDPPASSPEPDPNG
jgi:hypothetical protein